MNRILIDKISFYESRMMSFEERLYKMEVKL